MNEQQLDKAISALAPDIMPERDLWAGIEPQLAERFFEMIRVLNIHAVHKGGKDQPG